MILCQCLMIIGSVIDAALQVEAAVSCSAAEFKRAIAANGYRAQPDSKRVRMLQTITKVGCSNTGQRRAERLAAVRVVVPNTLPASTAAAQLRATCDMLGSPHGARDAATRKARVRELA
jgi:hypothetical protein